MVPPQVEVSCTARVPSSSGRQGEGTPYYSSTPDRPLCFTIGDGQVSSLHFMTSCAWCVQCQDQEARVLATGVRLFGRSNTVTWSSMHGRRCRRALRRRSARWRSQSARS